MARLFLREIVFYDIIIDVIVDYEILILMAHKCANEFIRQIVSTALLTLSRLANLSLLPKNDVPDMFDNVAYNLHLIDKEKFIRNPNIATVILCCFKWLDTNNKN